MRTTDREIISDIKDKVAKINIKDFKKLPKDVSDLLLQLRKSEKERIKKYNYRKGHKEGGSGTNIVTIEEIKTNEVSTSKNKIQYSFLAKWIANNVLKKKH